MSSKEKILIIRKDRKCDYCERQLHKGDSVSYFEGKFKRCDENDNQIGIEFFKNYMCLDCQKELCSPVYTTN
jgi:phage FluMu protein Com